MSSTQSTMLKLGTKAPAFNLPDPSGKMFSLEDFAGAKALIVVFMCNHCPYVRHLNSALAKLCREFLTEGVQTVAINSNDVANYPADAPELMSEESREHGYSFPYLYDESQEVAKSYQAACTPDFYIFDGKQELAYRGQFDGTRPRGDIPATGADLREALNRMLEGKALNEEQTPSMGCNIKWKPGNEPTYY